MVSNWKTSNITDLLKPNGIKIGPFGSQLKKELFVQSGDYKVYGQENVYAKDFTLGNRYMTRSHFDKLASCEILPGDFVMSTMGTIGKCAIVPSNITRGIMDSHLIRLRFDEKLIHPSYLLQLFSPDIQYLTNQTDKLSVGGIMDGLSVKIVSSLTVEYPQSIEEQECIVNVLSDMDGMISSLEKLIAKKKAVKQGAMQELLTGKKRLPGFTGEWVEKKIGAYGDFVSGNGFPLKYQGNPSGLYPFYKVSDFNNVGNSREMIKANNYISDDVANILSCNIIPKQSIVFAKIGAAIALERKRITSYVCCIDNNMMSFQPYEKETAQFMCYLFQTIRFGELVEATALPSLSGKTIGEIKKIFPPTSEEQIAISSILSDMDNEIEALERKLEKTRQIKQGMMQQLLTGKIRLV